MPPSSSETSPTASIARRLLGSTGWLVIGRLVTSACTLLILLQLAHHLPLAGFGRITFYLAVMMVIGSVSDLGTGQIVVQKSAQDELSLAALLRTGRRVRMVMALVSWLVWTLWVFSSGEPDALWLSLAGLFPLTFGLELSTVPMRNAIQLKAPVLIRTGVNVLNLVTVTLLIQNSVTRTGPLFFAMSVGFALGNVALHFFHRGTLPPKARQGVPWGPFLLATIPLGLGALCQQLYFWIDNVFIRVQLGEEALGLYNLPVRLFSFAILVAVLAPSAALPWLSREHAAGRLGPAIARLALPLLALGAGAAGFLASASGTLLQLFGESFPAAQSTFQYLLMALVFVHAGALLSTGIIATGRTGDLLYITVAALLTNLLGNAILIPSMGIDGAAVATSLTEGAVVLFALLALARTGVLPCKHIPLWVWPALPGIAYLGWIFAQGLLRILPA
ncbi:MAG: oligosaccharide flippase family protein [Planctomycetota bacterium]|nr:oligosaccharide flippase family protein [Planctomycetota bacterium]